MVGPPSDAEASAPASHVKIEPRRRGRRAHTAEAHLRAGRAARPAILPPFLAPASRKPGNKIPGPWEERGLSQPPQEVGAGDEADAARLPSGALLP